MDPSSCLPTPKLTYGMWIIWRDLPWPSITMFHSGIYCLLVVAHLLDLITPELLEGTAAFIASCQTYEGGFSCASQPFFSTELGGEGPRLLDGIRPPLGEAHGGYTFCALASWIMLQPYLDLYPQRAPRPAINYRSLLRWLVHLQGGQIELGGFKGRTNKLVDGCYSWWVGGCFALLASRGIGGGHGHDVDPGSDIHDEGPWDDDVDGKAFFYLACKRSEPFLVL